MSPDRKKDDELFMANKKTSQSNSTDSVEIHASLASIFKTVHQKKEGRELHPNCQIHVGVQKQITPFALQSTLTKRFLTLDGRMNIISTNETGRHLRHGSTVSSHDDHLSVIVQRRQRSSIYARFASFLSSTGTAPQTREPSTPKTLSQTDERTKGSNLKTGRLFRIRLFLFEQTHIFASFRAPNRSAFDAHKHLERRRHRKRCTDNGIEPPNTTSLSSYVSLPRSLTCK